MVRRRKEERQSGIASRGMVRRWGRCSSRVATGWSLIAIGCLSGATPRGQPWTSAVTQRAEGAADGGVVDVSQVLYVSPRAPRMHAQRVARFDPYNTRTCLPPKK